MFRFIRSSILAAGLMGLSLPGLIAPALISTALAEPIDPAKLIDPAKMKPQGSWQEVTWPATLDLAERAELSLNGLIHATDAASDSVYASFDFGQNPPASGTPSWFLNPRTLQVLPYLRTICGKDDGLDAEARMMKKMLLQIDAAGLVTSPDDTGWPKGTSVPLYNGQLALAMLTWHERDRNSAWLAAVDLISSGLGWTSIDVDDRAYYPLECSFKRAVGPAGLGALPGAGTWHPSTLGNSILPYAPPAEPDSDQQGYEGCAKYMTVSGPIEALAAHNRYKRDALALDRAMRLARFGLKPGMWQPANALGYPGNEHGVFAGQLTGNVHFLRALLELGIAKRSAYLKQFAREGYMYATRNGIARMGWYPAWVMPEKFQRPKNLHGISDNGGVAAMLMLAVKLSDAGMDDYWDHVDAIVRNQLIEQQFTDLSAMRTAAGGDPKNDAVLARFVGGCGAGEPTAIKPEISATASLSTAVAYYYAWHGITRFDHGLAQVNLFLNRASPWMDVESYLPFEGKVILRNKQAEAVRVRIPAWVELKNLKVMLNGKPIEAIQPGRCVMVEGIKNADVIELNFIVRERTDKYFIHDKTCTLQYRGSTVVDISPRIVDPRLIPMYQREAMKGIKAPMHKVKRFVAENLLPLQ